jgi:hypothetical protein
MWGRIADALFCGSPSDKAEVYVRSTRATCTVAITTPMPGAGGSVGAQGLGRDEVGHGGEPGNTKEKAELMPTMVYAGHVRRQVAGAHQGEGMRAARKARS